MTLEPETENQNKWYDKVEQVLSKQIEEAEDFVKAQSNNSWFFSIEFENNYCFFLFEKRTASGLYMQLELLKGAERSTAQLGCPKK